MSFNSNYQICHEFVRFSTYLSDSKVAVFYGGVHIGKHKDILKNECPHIVVGTPGRILSLARDKDLSLKNVRHFILDECDMMLESLDMRRDVQEIFKMTPHDKQVMLFSATLSKNDHLLLCSSLFTVGQGRNCNLRLRDALISSILCKLRYTEHGGATITLLEISGSKGIVQVNGRIKEKG